MEDTDNKRNNEIVKMPQSEDEVHAMLKEVEHLFKNLSITSENMAGSSEIGFSFNP